MSRTQIEATISGDIRPFKKDMQEAVAIAQKGARDIDKAGSAAGGGGAGGAGGKGGGKSNLAGGLLQAASAVDDVQYGLRGVLNNVIGIANYLPGWGKGLAAIGVMTGVVYTQWDKIENLISQKLIGRSMKELEEETKKLAKLTEEASRRAKIAAQERVEAMRATGAALREESEFLVAKSMERSTSEAHARVRDLNKQIAEANIEMASMSEKEKVQRMLAINQKFREEDYAARVKDMEKFRNAAMGQERTMSAQLLEERAKLRALQEKADAQFISGGSVATMLAAELEGQKAMVEAIEQAHASAADHLGQAQQESNKLVMERGALEKQRELDRIEAAKKTADIEKKAAKEAAEIRAKSMAAMVASVRRSLADLAATLKQAAELAAEQKKFREANDEQRKIDEARAAGREKKARDLERDRTERERAKQLQEGGNISEADAKKQAREERQRSEDADAGRRRSRRKSPGAERGSLLDEPRTSNLDDGKQRMKDLFEPRLPKNQPKPAAPAAAESTAGAVADAVGGSIPGGAAAVAVLKAILKTVSDAAATQKRKPVNNPRNAA